jgi:MSHA pilin protein MshD
MSKGGQSQLFSVSVTENNSRSIIDSDLTKNRGFTLIELVITLVILAIGVTAFTQLMNASTIASVDPMVRQQAHAVAQSYLEEVLLNSFCDPDLSTDCPTFCTGANICSTCGGSASPLPAETRVDFDDVCDYNVINDSGARDQFGNPIFPPDFPLANYNVNVTVDDSGVVLSGLSSANGKVVRVDVNVTHAQNPNVDVTLSAYKTNF